MKAIISNIVFIFLLLFLAIQKLVLDVFYITHQSNSTITEQLDVINSATGSIFVGEQIRTYTGPIQFNDETGPSVPQMKSANSCQKWNVVTTIFAPTEAVKRATSLANWCTVIVADTKTPKDYMNKLPSSVHFLSVETQRQWSKEDTSRGKFIRAIPYRHFARKNIGYWYAIAHGAEFIFDFDDDNYLYQNASGHVQPPLTNLTHVEDARLVAIGPNHFNHHPLMEASLSTSWPRGFPLNDIQNHSTQGVIALDNITESLENIAVLQYCADGNPDIDAIHRLVQPLPMSFKSTKPLLVPTHTFVPYNAQATVHTRSSFWALLLPFTVPGRVSDIWRGYFAQTLFHRLNLQIAILPATIRQERNAHDYLGDFNAEHDLYRKSGTLISYLDDWTCKHTYLPTCMESLWIDLYERSYIEVEDIQMLQLWLAALIDTGYEFPILKTPPLQSIVLMGQFNFQIDFLDALFWTQKWRQHFRHIVLRGPFTENSTQTLRQHGIQVFRGKDDHGFYSPVENLMLTLQQFRQVKGIQGIIYLHDDAVLNMHHFTTESFQNILTTNRYVDDPRIRSENKDMQNIFDGLSFYVEPDGNYSTLSGFRTNNVQQLLNKLKYWYHQEICLKSFRRMQADPQGQKYNEPDGRLFVVPYEQSDFMYIPMNVADEYIEAAQLMTKHKVFLECAIPKIVDIIRQRRKTPPQNIRLCTDWTKNRGEKPFIDECISSNATMIHPMKIKKLGRNDWKMYFDNVNVS